MIQNYFNSVLGLSEIPKQNLVTFTKTDGTAIVNVPLIYQEDLSIKTRSQFGGIGDPKSNTLMTLLSSDTNGIIPSGQFALQNVQVWKSTDPLDLSFSINLEMLDDGYNDVVSPSKTLMKLCLPEIRDSGLSQKLGLLIPPGPSLVDILVLSQSGSGSGLENDIRSLDNSLVNISVGNFKFNNCIVTECSPTFSQTVDENGYPVSAELSIEAKTCMVATREMIDSIV